MDRFRLGQRVLVKAVNHESMPLNLMQRGTVVKLRRNDEGAWIAFDIRSEQQGVHPFPVGDSREKHALAFPEDCEAL